MNKDIRNLQPKAVWNNFVDLNAVPRGSKKEEKVRQFMVDFGNNLGLETIVDPVGNVIIRKPASKGMENRKSVVLQSHLDMVHQKNNDTDFDFDTQGIQMKIEGDWVTADGTTLGADNGLGVAAIMGILESDDIKHPSLEALFTIDEETGMTGAIGLEAGYLNGDILLNLDTEDDVEIGVGCAGGIDVSATKSYEQQELTVRMAFSITISGLQGGHSGMDIHKGFGNANIIMNRLLFAMRSQSLVVEIDGGSLRNAIPRESKAIFICDDIAKSHKLFADTKKEIIAEYASIEKDLEITLGSADLPKYSITKADQDILLKTIYSLHNGVFRMSPDIEDLVETSNNVARVVVKDGTARVECLTRSSVESGKTDMVNTLSSSFDLGGFDVSLSGSYPGWKPNPNSEIVKLMASIYEKRYQEKAHILACHAGLECGILGTNYPDMDMVSFGPTIKGAHSPDEKANIPSTQKFWGYLVDILANIPEKK